MGGNTRFVLDGQVGFGYCDRTQQQKAVPLAQKRANVFLPEGLLADIDQLFGKGQRSAFLTELAEREIKRQNFCAAR
jgi:hypothetical protein